MDCGNFSFLSHISFVGEICVLTCRGIPVLVQLVMTTLDLSWIDLAYPDFSQQFIVLTSPDQIYHDLSWPFMTHLMYSVNLGLESSLIMTHPYIS